MTTERLSPPDRSDLLAWLRYTGAAERAKHPRPNKAWACKKLLDHAAGLRFNALDVRLAGGAMALTNDEMTRIQTMHAGAVRR